MRTHGPTPRGVGDRSRDARVLAAFVGTVPEPPTKTSPLGAGTLALPVAGAVVNINPYIALKADARPTGSPAKARMFEAKSKDPVGFKARYIRRVQSESGIFALKERYGRKLDTRLPMAQYNELSARCICHNIYCVLRAKHEFSLEPRFFMPQPTLWTPSAEEPDDSGLLDLAGVLHSNPMNETEEDR